MTIDPTDYDLGELREAIRREASGGPSGGNGRKDDRRVDATLGTRGPSRSADSIQSQLYRELFLLTSAAGQGLEKPYLPTVPRTFASEVVVFEWLEFLLERAGFKRTMDVLRYYRRIDWLSEDAEASLREYLGSIQTDEPERFDDLDRTDHLLSLVFIARLASMADAE